MTKFIQWATLTVFLGLLSAPTQAQTPLFGNFGEPAWSRMFKYIESRFGAVANDDFVLVLPTATDAAWDDPIKTFRLMEMYKWGDWMPSRAWQYAPNSEKRISDGYQFFLNSALNAAVAKNGTLSADAKTALLKANDEVTFTRGEYNRIQGDAADAYENYLKSPGLHKSKREYYKDQGWDIEIKTRKNRLDSASETLEFVTANIVDPDIQLLKQAIQRYNNPNQRIWLPPIREVYNNKDRWQQYFVSYLDKDIFAFLNEDVPQHQTIDESQSQSDYFEQHWHASASVSFLGLFRAGGLSAEQVKKEEHIKNNVTKIDVDFANLDTFNVVRGEWFSDNVVSRFAPFLKGEAYTSVWGPNGQMELLPKSVLIGRGMKFTVYADSQSLDYLYEHFEASADAGFFIGWWRIGGEGGYSTTKSQTKVYKYNDRIEFTDLSGRAKVLAVLCKYYAGGLPRDALSIAMTDAERKKARSEIEAEWSGAKAAEALSKKVDKDVAPDVLMGPAIQ